MSGDAELVLVGGKIFTSSKEKLWAKALAVRGDRLVAVGTDAQAERWSGRGTKTIDLHGRVVVPGFIDAHAHMVDAAVEFAWAHLDGTASMGAALERMKALAARTPPGDWVVGVDWDEAKWPERRYFLRGDLDQVSTHHPVVAVLPKAGVFAHGQAETVAHNLAAEIKARGKTKAWDGHGACFLEVGRGQSAFVTGNFLAAPKPDLDFHMPGKVWHMQKVLFERHWMKRWF